MTSEFRTRRRVEFHETDMAGIVHFSNFFRYMEAVEHEFLRTLGLSAHTEAAAAMTGFARVHATCDYRQPLRYPEEFEIQLLVKSIGRRSIRYQFRFRVADDQEIARGEIVVAHVRRSESVPGLEPVELPPSFLKALQPAAAELLTDESNLQKR